MPPLEQTPGRLRAVYINAPRCAYAHYAVRSLPYNVLLSSGTGSLCWIIVTLTKKTVGEEKRMTLHRVDKLSDERLTEYVRLTDHQLRDLVDPAHSRMICESALVIKTALDMNLVPSSLFIEERRMESIKDILDRIPSEVPIYVATGDLMSAVCGYHVTRGSSAVFRGRSK